MWMVFVYFIFGFFMYGGVGWLLDCWFGMGFVFFLVGFFGGMVFVLYVVWVWYGVFD